MPSNSFLKWERFREPRLDEIEHAHSQVGGIARGRRFATLQINYAYTMLLSAEFQGFCRDLHSECVDHLTQAIQPGSLKTVLREEFTLHRKLDRGNPNSGNIGADFSRSGISFIDEVKVLGIRNVTQLNHLERLNLWRNAIAHNDFAPKKLGATMSLRMQDIRQWRFSCRQLATAFDRVMNVYLAQITGTGAW